jgi:hypothetical protein
MACPNSGYSQLLRLSNTCTLPGDLDLVVQLTWVTLYYENMGLPRQPGLTFVERPDVNLLSTSLRFFAPPVIFDMDNDGETPMSRDIHTRVFYRSP